MDIDREVAEAAVRDHLRQFGRFDGVEVTLDTHDLGEGWQVVVQPANSYLHRRELTLGLFVDRADGRVHHNPSSGTKALIARLRGTI